MGEFISKIGGVAARDVHETIILGAHKRHRNRKMTLTIMPVMK